MMGQTDERTDILKEAASDFFFATLITFYGKFEKSIDLNKKCLQSKEERKKIQTFKKKEKKKYPSKGFVAIVNF